MEDDLKNKNYIKKNNLDNFLHLQIPRRIWNLFLDKEMSPGAFKIYIEFFDRLKLSAYNNWVDQEKNVYIKYSYEEIMREILKNRSRGTVTSALTELKNLGLIIQEKGFSTSSKFYLTNILSINLQKTEKQSNEENIDIEENQKTEKRSTEDCKRSPQKTGFTVPNNNYYSHNNEIITTTTDKIKNTNSREFISIKEYLNSNKIDDFTKNNILKISEKNKLNLNRVQEVFEYMGKNDKGYGFVVQALKNNWKLKLNKKSENLVSEKIIKGIYNYALDYRQFNYNKNDILNIYDENTKKHKNNCYVKKYRKKLEEYYEEKQI